MAEHAKRKGSSSDARRMLDEMLEMGDALDAHGLITKPDLAQLRGLCQKPPVYTPRMVALIRKNKARMSQSVFASLLNVSVSTVQKWEAEDSGKRPSGAAAKLLQLIDQRGVDAITI